MLQRTVLLIKSGFYNEHRCYNEQSLSIKSGCYNEHRCYNEQFLSIKSECYNESGGILFIMESSITVFTNERLFVLFTFTRAVYKSWHRRGNNGKK